MLIIYVYEELNQSPTTRCVTSNSFRIETRIKWQNLPHQMSFKSPLSGSIEMFHSSKFFSTQIRHRLHNSGIETELCNNIVIVIIIRIVTYVKANRVCPWSWKIKQCGMTHEHEHERFILTWIFNNFFYFHFIAVAPRCWNGAWAWRWYLPLFNFMATHFTHRFCQPSQQARNSLLQQLNQRIDPVNTHSFVFFNSDHMQRGLQRFFFFLLFLLHFADTTSHQWSQFIIGTYRYKFKISADGRIRPSSIISPILQKFFSNSTAIVLR